MPVVAITHQSLERREPEFVQSGPHVQQAPGRHTRDTLLPGCSGLSGQRAHVRVPHPASRLFRVWPLLTLFFLASLAQPTSSWAARDNI